VSAVTPGQRAALAIRDRYHRIRSEWDKETWTRSVGALIDRETGAPDLLAACEAVLPWVAIAMAHRTKPHPEAVANHAADLETLIAAIARAKGGNQ
jgi:hypothetical protein